MQITKICLVTLYDVLNRMAITIMGKQQNHVSINTEEANKVTVYRLVGLSGVLCPTQQLRSHREGT